MLAGTTALHAQTFTFTTLDNPGDPTFNQLLGINNKNELAGFFTDAAGNTHGMIVTVMP